MKLNATYGVVPNQSTTTEALKYKIDIKVIGTQTECDWFMKVLSSIGQATSGIQKVEKAMGR